MQKDIQYTLMGFPTTESAESASMRVAQVIDEVAAELGLSTKGLDGITIAVDYDAALQKLDRGFQSDNPLTRTNDEFGSGVAMTPCVLRDGRVMSHIVLSASIVPLIDAPMLGVSGKYIIGHELSHAHEHYFRDRVLPNTLLNIKITKPDDAVLFETADACWGEYAACYFSAPIHADQARLFELAVVPLLRKAKDEIVDAKRDWISNRDFGKVWQRIGTTAFSLLKYFSYLLGHAAGLNRPVQELAPGTWELLQLNPWLLPWIEKLDDALVTMLNTFEHWKGLETFEPLKQVGRGLLMDCGITISDLDGSLYVYVAGGKLPV